MKLQYSVALVTASLIGFTMLGACSSGQSQNPASETQVDPCAGDKSNPCAANPCAAGESNPCAAGEESNPCASENPCASS